MAYCGPRGIPLTEFLAWDETDQDAALAWQSYESRRCREDGQLVPATSLPVLAAACAVDPDLQDEAWWAEQLNGDSWSLGERDGLYRELLDLNLSRPRPGTPKG